MSAMRQERAERPPTFSTSVVADVDVDVDIDPAELEEAGWVYVGKNKGASVETTNHVVSMVMRWHDDEHPDPWRWCRHSLCDAVRGREAV